MQINAFGFPLGTSTAGGAAAGAPALGFLQALGVAGVGQPMAPTGGPAVLPVTSLADTGPTMTLTAGAAPGTGFGASPLLPPAALSAADAATPLLPQGNDTLASLTKLSAAPLPASTAAAPAAAASADVKAQPTASDKPILATLQTTTSLSGLLATATRPVVETPTPSTAKGVTAQPVIQPETLTASDASTQAPLIGAEAALDADAPVVVEMPVKDAAPVKGKPAKPAAQESDAPVATDAASQPLVPAAPVAQPLPQQVPASAQLVAQQPQADAQPAQVGSRQHGAAGKQANVADMPGRATRKSGVECAQLGDAPQTKSTDAVGGDFDRAVQATNGGDNGAMSQDGQPRDPQVKLDGAVASVSQPSQTAPATGNTAAAPAAPLAQEPVVATRPGQFGHAMGVEIARKVEAGEETLRVRLNPDNLGRVEVTLAFEDGNLKATVRAESQRALDLLRQDMPDLARTLDQAGVRTDAQSFRFEARADTGSGQQQQGNGQQQRGGNPQQQHAQADDLEPAPAYRAIRADGQVDLLA